MFKDRLIELLNEKLNGNQSLLSEYTKIPKTTINGWLTTEREPNSRQLINLADYFQCSIDYLIGRENDIGLIEIKTGLTSDETELITLYKKLNYQNKNQLLGFAKALAY